jgi:hypothetical protein
MAETWKKVAYYDEVATTFLGLSDTPANYTDAGLKLVRVNVGTDALEYVAVADLNAVMDADFTAKGDLMTASAASTPSLLAIGTDNYILCVSTDTPAWDSPATVAATMALDDIGVPDAAVDLNGQEIQDVVAHQSSATPDPVKGKYYYDTDDDHLYVCTSAA